MTDTPTADITQEQLSHVCVIKGRLWPYPARRVAIRHNQTKHAGVPTAHIDPDPNSKGRLPQYVVWCPVCKNSPELQRAKTKVYKLGLDK